MTEKLSHLDAEGNAHMVDISNKPTQYRQAIAQSEVILKPETIELIQSDGLPKGDVLAVARIAGIQAAKQTQYLIPLCHQLPLTRVSIEFSLNSNTSIQIEATCKTLSQTGVEMEALTAVSVSALTIYDMVKAVDKSVIINQTKLIEKTKSDTPN